MIKKIGVITSILILIAIGVITFVIVNNISKNEHNSTNNQVSNINQEENLGDDKKMNNDNKTLILYFSATGNTEKIAEYIKKITGGDMIEIIPKEKYTSDDLNYNSDCRANREQNDSKSRPEIKNEINVANYDTIYLGYPIWWGTIPKIILTLLDNYDLSGKSVIPFCTSGGSGISQSESDLQNYNAKINWIKGQGFYASTKESEVSSWIENLDIN